LGGDEHLLNTARALADAVAKLLQAADDVTKDPNSAVRNAIHSLLRRFRCIDFGLPLLVTGETSRVGYGDEGVGGQQGGAARRDEGLHHNETRSSAIRRSLLFVVPECSDDDKQTAFRNCCWRQQRPSPTPRLACCK
jgi:hypothetical protein